MPMNISKAKTAKGHPYLKIHSHGEVTAADADALTRTIAAGGENAALAVLATVDSGAKFSPEARNAFTRASGGSVQDAKPVAVVVTSAPLRVMLSFIIRMSGAASATRFFASEAEALAHLDEKLG